VSRKDKRKKTDAPKGRTNSQQDRSTFRHIKPSSKNTQQTTTDQDSTTLDNLVLCGERRSCTFKGNRKLWKEFVSYSKANYGSVCHILEPILLAVLKAEVVHSDTIRSLPPPVVIENLHIERVVQRHRRVSHEYESETNYYDAKETLWKYVPCDPSELNVNGHVGGCGCRDCRRIAERGSLKIV
jgi:hypothetical protein